MVNIENGCNWYFPELAPGIDEQNITNSDDENFKDQSSIEALVRESIQNSLDVHNPDNDKPVIVEFKFGSIDNAQETIPNFLKIKEHIQGAKEYLLSRGNENANIYFDPMLEFMETHKKSFPYLCVSDFNTIGMDYAEEGRSRFFSFMNKGFNDKSGLGSGGSYGIGKAAYYMFSAIRTILISSMYKDVAGTKKCVFKGSAKLTTHKIGVKKYYDKGHYDIINATPVTESRDIPNEFLRNIIGTSIFIMGIDDSESGLKENYNKIIKSVVRNFWFAIMDEKLVVKVDFEEAALGTEVIDSNKLKEIIPTYEEFDRTGEYTNPRPYYEAVSTSVVFNPQAPDQPAVYFDNNHQEFGHARFYLIKNDQKHDRYIKMRSPRMFVSMEKVGGKRGFNGVLVCDDKWNELLTYAEPPAHDNWDKKRIREKNTIDTITQKKAIQALSLITSWVTSCIASYFNEEHGNDMDFIGTKDLLYTDKDFGSNSRHDGNANSHDEGTPSDEEGDYGIATSKSLGIDGDNQTKVRPIASVTAINKYNAMPQKDGKLLSNRKKKKKKKKKKEEKREKQPGHNFPVREHGLGKLGKYREVFDVAVRCFIPSGQEDKHLYTMVISTNRPIKKAMVEVITGAAIGTIEVPIAYTDKGIIDKNSICDIPLEAGNNILHFKFNDNISHKVTTATYEFK